MENDPKLSPNGDKIAFMRMVNPGLLFGWHLFVLNIAGGPGTEVDISSSHIGFDLLMNDAVPEWIDNDTLVFFTIEIFSATDVRKHIYTMKDDGSQRTKIPLPQGFIYSHVASYKDATGDTRIIFAAQKESENCS